MSNLNRNDKNISIITFSELCFLILFYLKIKNNESYCHFNSNKKYLLKITI